MLTVVLKITHTCKIPIQLFHGTNNLELSAGIKPAPFTSVDSPNVTFSSPATVGSDPTLLSNPNSVFPSQALSANPTTMSSIVMGFTGPVSSLSLDFQGDIPILAGMLVEARLIGLNGATEVVSMIVTPDFINNFANAPPQNIAIMLPAGFTQATFAFYLNGSPSPYNIGTEGIDNIVFSLIQQADFFVIPVANGNAAVIDL